MGGTGRAKPVGGKGEVTKDSFRPPEETKDSTLGAAVKKGISQAVRERLPTSRGEGKTQPREWTPAMDSFIRGSTDQEIIGRELISENPEKTRLPRGFGLSQLRHQNGLPDLTGARRSGISYRRGTFGKIFQSLAEGWMAFSQAWANRPAYPFILMAIPPKKVGKGEKVASKPYTVTLHIDGKTRELSWAAVRAIDSLMAYGELASQVNPSYFDAVHDLMIRPKRQGELPAPPRLVQPLMPLAFSNLVKRIRDPKLIGDDVAWKKVQAELMFYWLGLDFSRTNNSNHPYYFFQITLSIIRALRRMAKQPGSEGQWKFYYGRLSDILFDANKRGSNITQEKALIELHKEVVRNSSTFDPLVPIQGGKGDSALILLTQDLLNLIPKLALRKYEFQGLLNSIGEQISQTREHALKTNQIETFMDLLAAPIPLLERMKDFYEFRNPKPDPTRMPFIKGKPSRPVIWNPFSLPNDKLVIHPSMGEGEILKIDGDMATVKYQGQVKTIKTLAKNLVPVTDREKYHSIQHQRIQRFSKYADEFGLLLSRAVLSIHGEDRVSEKVKGKWHDILTYSIGRIQTPPVPKIVIEKISEDVGIDLIAFGIRLAVGQGPAEITAAFDASYKRIPIELNRIFTGDIIRGFLEQKPWQVGWQGSKYQNSVVQAVGYYYPGYYRGIRQGDLTELYFKYREGDAAAFEKVSDIMGQPVANWMAQNDRKGNALIVPIPGTAPNEALAKRLGPNVVNPWLPRPKDYGKGVEGKRAWLKLQMVQAAMKLKPEILGDLEGKSILLIDDNITDGVTYMVARKLLLDAGAKEVGIVVLTQTIRDPKELDYSLK